MRPGIIDAMARYRAAARRLRNTDLYIVALLAGLTLLGIINNIYILRKQTVTLYQILCKELYPTFIKQRCQGHNYFHYSSVINSHLFIT